MDKVLQMLSLEDTQVEDVRPFPTVQTPDWAIAFHFKCVIDTYVLDHIMQLINILLCGVEYIGTISDIWGRIACYRFVETRDAAMKEGR